MPFRLAFTTEAADELKALEYDEDQRDLIKLKKVRKCLGYLEANPKHPGLNSHKYSGLKGPRGEDVWESYVENNASSAWRVFWHYGPAEKAITVLAITPHP